MRSAFGGWIPTNKLVMGSWYIVTTEFRIAGGVEDPAVAVSGERFLVLGSVAVPSVEIGDSQCGESCGKNENV